MCTKNKEQLGWQAFLSYENITNHWILYFIFFLIFFIQYFFFLYTFYDCGILQLYSDYQFGVCGIFTDFTFLSFMLPILCNFFMSIRFLSLYPYSCTAPPHVLFLVCMSHFHMSTLIKQIIQFWWKLANLAISNLYHSFIFHILK